MHSIKNKIGLILIIFVGIFIVPFNAFGKNTNDSNSSTSASSGGSKADKACANTLRTNKLLNVKKDNNGTTYTLTINAGEGQWDIYYKLADADDTDWYDIVTEKGTIKNNTNHYEYKGGSPSSIPISRGKDTQMLYVIALAKGNKDNHVLSKDGNELYVTYDQTKKTTCKSGGFSITEDNKISFKGTGAALNRTIVSLASSHQPKELSEKAKRECEAMRGSKLKTDSQNNYFSYKGLDDNMSNEMHEAYQKEMQKSFSFCYPGNTYDADYTIKASDIKEIRKKSLEAFYYYYQTQKKSQNNEEYKKLPKEGYAEITNLDDNKFNCKATDFQSELIKKYYYEKTEVDNNACKVTCRENYEITYSPPQVVKAGLCFNYTVTIKSKVACKTEMKGDISFPTLILPTQKQCVLSPVCENDSNETQAGPNEKFDSCISSCDGGKYTQKCINSCYNKIYTKKSKVTKTTSKTTKQKPTMLNNTDNNKNNVIKLANKAEKTASDPYKNVNGCTSVGEIQKNWDDCGAKFSKLKKEYPMGYYFEEGENDKWPSWVDLKWKPCFNTKLAKCEYENDKGEKIKYSIEEYNAENYFVRTVEENGEKKEFGTMDIDNLINNIKRSSPYYFATATRATKTLKSFYGEGTGRNGKNGKRFYVIDNRGIKRQHSHTYHCSEKCGFILDEEGIKETDCKQSKSGKKVDKYIKELEGIIDDFKACIASDKCADNEAEFEIKVDTKKGKDEKECTNASPDETKDEGKNWKNKKNQCPTDETKYEENIKERPNLIFMPIDKNDVCYGINGKCYGNEISGNPYHYKTTITTPGSWINLKTGEVKYKKPTEENIYRAKDTYYCTPYNACDVNADWAKQVIENTTIDENGTSTIDGSKISKPEEIDYNIIANMLKFGKYDASFELSCFYGSYSKAVGSQETCYKNNNGKKTECIDDTGKPLSEQKSTKLQNNYDIRISDNASIFPQKNGKDRIRGYNWGSDAKLNSSDQMIKKALDDTGYGVDPVKYSQEVIAKKDSIYNGEADMIIEITKNGMADLKKSDNNITLNGEYKKVAGIPGLYYYQITDGKITKLITSRKWNLGANSQTAKEAMKK